MKVLNTCKCGNKFWVKSSELLRGYGMFCSNKCKYKYRKIHPKGLKYILNKINPTWFKTGHNTWCKGMKGIHLNPKHEWKKGDMVDDKNTQWKGNNVGYCGLHTWIARKLGKPTECTNCGKISTAHDRDWETGRER